MELRHPPGIWIALCDCTDPAREPEFTRWYEEVFIPHREALGFLRHSRLCENVMANTPTFLGRPKYLALWEVYRDDMKEVLKEVRRHDAALIAGGRGFDAMIHRTDTLYSRLGQEIRTERSGQPVQGVYLAMTYCTDLTREDEFNRWYSEKHSPEMLALGYHDTAYRYQVVDPMDPVPHQTPYVGLYETSIDPVKARSGVLSHRSKWLEDPLWGNLMGLHFTGQFRHIYPPPEGA